MDGARVADVDEIPPDSSFLFTVSDGDEEREAILVRVDDGGSDDVDDGSGEDGVDGGSGDGDRVAAWFNYCQHFTHIRIDKGSGAPFRNGEVVCTNHGAMFDADTGLCTFGPCEGAYLESIDVTVRDGRVYLTDEDWEFVAAGPKERDPLDLASKSNVEF